MPLLGISPLGSAPAAPINRHARHRLETRRRLAAAGRHLIGARGFDGFAIAEIAAEADVGVGSFYNHFRSKEDLLAVVTAEAAGALAEVLERLTATMTDPAQRVAACVRYVVRRAERDPAWAWFVVRVSEALGRPAMNVTAPIERYVLAGIGCGRFPADDPTVAVNAVGGALLRVMRAKLLGRVGPNADRIVAEQVLRLLGLAPAAARTIAARSLPLPGDDGAGWSAARWPLTRKEGSVPCPRR